MENGALLAAETAFFEENDERFQREYPGRYLLIHGEEVIGDFPDREEAITEGVRQFNAGPFLVRKPGEAEIQFTAPAYSLGLLTCPS